MCKFIRHINITILVIIILTEITTLAITIISAIQQVLLHNLFENHILSYFQLSGWILRCLLATTLMIPMGINMVYFKQLTRCCCYFTFLSVIPSMSAVLLLLEIVTDLVPKEETASVMRFMTLMQVLFFLAIWQILLYPVALLSGYFYKKHLKCQVIQSPLNQRFDTMNEDLYRNIIDLSKNPDDERLRFEYRRLSGLTLRINDTVTISKDTNSTNSM